MIPLGRHLLRFFLPWACAGCRVPLESFEDHGFCGRCWLAIPRIHGLVCRACGVPLKDGGASCFNCRRDPSPVIIRAAAKYSGVIPRAVYRFKYAGRKTLASPFASLLRFAWANYPELRDFQALVPVPLHPTNERVRGFNQAQLLADEFGLVIRKPVFSILIRTRKTPSQVDLNRRERQDNMRSAFALHPWAVSKSETLKGLSLLLIDDICTTTSTLSECARVLRRAGVQSVKALVLARDL